jgi:bifunctional NMN adenylyltransferase/nudix hydrolase
VTDFDCAVLIGRFQPFHLGHEKLFRHAASIARHVIIIMGSHNCPVSIRNPWDSHTREKFIRLSLPDIDISDYTISFIADSAYDFNDWLIRVRKRVASIAGEDSRIAVVGHFKDDTSYYLSYFPQWNLEILPTQACGISSTSIREACFEGSISTIKAMVAPGVYDELNKWITTGDFRELLEEYRFIKDFRSKWKDMPSAPAFVTAETVLVALGHVLIIKRKIHPGKGRYSLPGGFVRQDETIEQAALRELKSIIGIETGYEELSGSIKMSQVFDHPARDLRGRVITHAFMIELAVRTLPEVKAGDIADEVIWCPLNRLEELESNFFGDHAQIIRFFINRMHDSLNPQPSGPKGESGLVAPNPI